MTASLSRAVWTTAEQNDLPDSSFAVIEPGGKKDSSGKTTPRSLRHLPFKDADGKVDLPHLRNALARLPQAKLPPDLLAKARKALEAAAKEAGVGEENKDRTMLSVYAPLSRIDQATREIEGVLSDEQVDTYGTIFDYDAMKAAVQRWPGNIREQHDAKKAVGRRVNARFDDEQRQVILRARISEGAEDTWKKILDGTLAGFSIGVGRYAPPVQRTKGDQMVPTYTDFDLAEASVVDAPSNPGAAQGLMIYRADGADGEDAETFAVLDPEPVDASPVIAEPVVDTEAPVVATSTEDATPVAEPPITEPETEVTRAAASAFAAMAKDTGTAHDPHAHAHGSFDATHTHDHTHTHADGTKHAHPHMHDHAHHDHAGDSNDHAHPHTHVHDHSHTFRNAAPDLSKTDEPMLVRVTPQDAAVDKAISKVAAALNALKAAQSKDEDAEGDKISPEDAAVDKAIAAAMKALDGIKSAQADDEASDPDDAPERAIDTGTGLEGHDPNTGSAEPAVRADGSHAAFTGTHSHAHAAYGSQGDDATHDHAHTHDGDAAHGHTHAEERVTTPTLDRAGQRISGDTRTGLHGARDALLNTCGCPECGDMLALLDPNAADADVDDTDTLPNQAVSPRLTRALLHRAAQAAVQQSVAPLVTQFRALAARLATSPDVPSITAQLAEVRTTLGAVEGLVRVIAAQEQPGGPVLRAVDRTLGGLTPDTNAPKATGGMTDEEMSTVRRLAQMGILTTEEQLRAAQMAFRQQQGR